MKQYKKILCSIILTSFVIIGSINVFALNEDDGDSNNIGNFANGSTGSITAGATGVTENTDCTEKVMVNSENRNNAERYVTEGEYEMNLDIEGQFGVQDEQQPNPNPDDWDGDGLIDITYKVIYNYNGEWVEEDYNCEEGWAIVDGRKIALDCDVQINDDPGSCEQKKYEDSGCYVSGK